MKHSALAFLLFTATALTAAPARAEETKLFDGLYVGLHAGYSWQDMSGRFDGNTNAVNLAAIDLNSAIVGGQLGYNLQVGSIVMGVEGDATAHAEAGDTLTTPNNEMLSGDISYLASIRSRLGVVLGEFLIYGTAGVAFTEFQFTENAPGAGFNGTLRLKKEIGGVYGGGLEWKFASRLSLRGEYLHYDIDGSSLLPGSFSNADSGDVVNFHDIDVARAGINIDLSP